MPSRKEIGTPSAVNLRRSAVFKRSENRLPLINPRPFLYTALGLIFGILLYTRVRFGFLKPTDLIPFLILFFASARSFSRKRATALFLCFFIFAGVGAGLMHLYCNRYCRTFEAGEYEVSGTVLSFSEEDGTSSLLLGELTLNGETAGGKMLVSLPTEELRTGDVITFPATIKPNGMPDGSSYAENLLVKDVRYLAGANDGFTVVGKGNAFLRLNAGVYDVLHEHLGKTQADAAYALLSGNSGSMDESFAVSIRQGGVAHIFSVSGLHIGILYGAVSLAFCFCKKFRFFPAIAAAVLYSAFCGFSVSSLRAVVMCAVTGVFRITGRKYDFFGAVAFSCTLVLLIRPAEWLSAGFRLSFGACTGLALFTHPLKRAFKKLPAFLGNYLSANLAVQIFTFPVLIECFGYVSVWGTLLNMFLIPALPVLFLGLFLCTALALCVPAAAHAFLAVPNGMLSSFSLLFSFDYSLVLTGVSLGASGAVYLVGTAMLSERVNLGRNVRPTAAVLLGTLFAALLVLENTAVAGCKLTQTHGAVLVETPNRHVLIIDGKRSTNAYYDFLSRNYAGTPDAVIVLSENPNHGINAALPLSVAEIHVYGNPFTGLTETVLCTEESFTCGSLAFRYESACKLTLIAEDRVVEIDFTDSENLGADLFLSGKSDGVYALLRGCVYRIN